MKKFLGLMVTFFAVLPLTVGAATGISFGEDCSKEANDQGYKTCTVSYVLEEANAKTSLEAYLTEKGDAKIINIESVNGAEFGLAASPTKDENGVYRVQLSSLDPVSGELDLFKITYQVVKETDTIEVKVDNYNATINSVINNEQTGSTLPYIALGALALIATAVYVSTKNKSKMFKI